MTCLTGWLRRLNWRKTETTNGFEFGRLVWSQIGPEQSVGAATASGFRTEYSYDLAGNVVMKRVGDAATTFEYDERGRLVWTIDALGQVESYVYEVNEFLLIRMDRNGKM